MFNLGFMEMIVVGVIALVFIGPKQLPEIARVLGRMINEFKKATSELSGGLLDIKNELREPFEEGMQAVDKIRTDIVKRTETAMNSVQDLHKDLHGDLHGPGHGKKDQAFNPPHVVDEKTIDINPPASGTKDENDPEKV